MNNDQQSMSMTKWMSRVTKISNKSQKVQATRVVTYGGGDRQGPPSLGNHVRCSVLSYQEGHINGLIKHHLSLGRPKRQSTASASVPSEPCKLCARLSPRSEVERLGGFCSERHKWDWSVIVILRLFRDRQLILMLPDHSGRRWNFPVGYVGV